MTKHRVAFQSTIAEIGEPKLSKSGKIVYLPAKLASGHPIVVSILNPGLRGQIRQYLGASVWNAIENTDDLQRCIKMLINTRAVFEFEFSFEKSMDDSGIVLGSVRFA